MLPDPKSAHLAYFDRAGEIIARMQTPEGMVDENPCAVCLRLWRAKSTDAPLVFQMRIAQAFARICRPATPKRMSRAEKLRHFLKILSRRVIGE